MGSLGFFSGLNVVTLVMVFLFVKKTKQRSLEKLDHIFAVSKRNFIRFQTMSSLPWAIREYAFGSIKPRSRLYRDLIWGSALSESGELQRTATEPVHHTNTEPIELRQTPMFTPGFSGLERPYAAELEEIYFPGIQVPYPREYEDGQSPTVRVDDSVFRNCSFPR